MSTYSAEVIWRRQQHEPFTDNRYSRAHAWKFDGGAEVPASSSPHIVPLPYSDEACVDPEEAFVASLSSCHMLFFLAIAARRGFVIEEYRDAAEGQMRRDAEGKMAMTRVTLRPVVDFGATQPSRTELEEMHHEAHERCFIANSVKTQVVTELPQESP